MKKSSAQQKTICLILAFSILSPLNTWGRDIEPRYAFGNPAGCATKTPADLSPSALLANVQAVIGDKYDLTSLRQLYIWNGPLGMYLDVSADLYVYEFAFNDFQHPLTYRADSVVTIFLNNGFAVWLRAYAGSFRLTAIPLTAGVVDSAWAEYAVAYWQKDGVPRDKYIYPVIKKLPCHWIIDAGFADNAALKIMFRFDWLVPDYLSVGRAFLADTCQEANRVSREIIDYWDAASMCGPLAWRITRDSNGFPYRVGSWSANAGAFIGANPKWNAQPWGSFDPSTFTLTRINSNMAGFDFEKNGQLYPGDLIYSYATPYVTPGYFDHIFLVAGIGPNGSRLSISNMVRNSPFADCSIDEITLYTPGDREGGTINHEWNGFGFGKTGTTGFDIFRWNWITYHANAKEIQYTARWGDTLETIGFDWKVSPQAIAKNNQLSLTAQLFPGQIISLPALIIVKGAQ